MRADGRLLRGAGLIVAIGVLLTGCAVSGYDAGSTRQHLVDAGLTAEAADCVVLHMGPRFGDERLAAHDAVSDGERRAMRALLETCDATVATH